MLGKLFSKKRILICTFVALASGFFGSYLGGQISWLARTAQCQNQPEGLDRLCRAWQTPGALWKGSVAGAWTGTILGVFVAGLATRDAEKQDRQPELIEKDRAIAKSGNSPPLEGLTADEIATLRRILRSLLEAEKKSSSNPQQPVNVTDSDPSASNNSKLSFSQFLDWADAVAKSAQISPSLTRNQGREILIYLGLPETTIDKVWQNLNQLNQSKDN